MEYVLKTNNLSKLYRRKLSRIYFSEPALKGLNMSVPKGSIYGLVGKNGAGKSTLIRIICGLEDKTCGDFSIFSVSSRDKNITKVRRRMGAVVETPSIHLELSARENIIQQYTVLGLPADDSIDKLLKSVNLEKSGNKKVKDFSLGMKQRLSIAIALSGEPDFLVLDEPINGVDPQGIIDIRELLLKINREKGVTILISSHILDELSRIATHFGFIEKGKIVEEISRDELLQKCKKCVKLRVSDVKQLSMLLEKEKTEYEILSDCEANIFGEVDVSDLIFKLKEFSCDVKSVTEHDETLESYYVNLLGGGENE